MTSLVDIVSLCMARLVATVLRLLPEHAAETLARLVVRGFVAIIGRYKGIALRNLELVFPDLSEKSRRDIWERSLTVLAKNIVTFSKIPDIDRRTVGSLWNYAEVEPLVRQLRAKAGGSGLLLPTLHFGSFEYLVQAKAILDRPVGILARPFGLARLDRWWSARREFFGNEVFGRTGGYNEMVSRLKKGQDVAVLFDQNVKVNHAVFVDFLGIPAATTKSVALAALRTAAPILFSIVIEQEPGHFKFVVTEVKDTSPEGASFDERVKTIMENLNREATKAIRAHPEQWFWIHRRFKTRPSPRDPDLYKTITALPPVLESGSGTTTDGDQDKPAPRQVTA